MGREHGACALRDYGTPELLRGLELRPARVVG
jgi:hypothetical protein